MIKDNTYDITLLFGPMYHLISYEDKLKALNEAKRVVKEINNIVKKAVSTPKPIVPKKWKEKECLYRHNPD